MRLLFTVLAVVVISIVIASPGVAATDPPVDVPASAVAKTLVCQPGVAPRHAEPVLLLGGPWSAHELWTWGWQRSLRRAGHPSCYLDLPQHGIGDMQISARQVVLAIRAVHARAHGPIAIYGVGWGGLLARLALTGWPEERRVVSDVVSVSAIQHGSQAAGVVSCQNNCPVAMWQRRAGSQLLTALDRSPDETPNPTAWTTVRSSDDVIATPADGPRPTSALSGATNLLLQNICPARRYRDSLGLAFDSLAFAALGDALNHPGPARRARMKRACARQYAPGLTQATVTDRVSRATNASTQRILAAPRVDAEPPVLSPFDGT